MKNKDNLYRWKYEILLKEIAFSYKFTSNYDTFTKLKEAIEKRNLIWESTIELVKFTINNAIKAKIILDQYKEAYDKDNINIKEIIDLIIKDKLNNVHLIISSSINNKDVRNSLLKQWFPNYNKKISILFDYDYYAILFNSKLYVQEDKDLSEIKKKYINDYFNNIPRFYYDIKYLEDDKLEEYKKNQQNKILEKISLFYEEECISNDDYGILLNYRQKIGKLLEDDEQLVLLQAFPLKYFIFKEKIIDFYFPLVEIAFDNYLENKVCSFLRGPLKGYNDGFIGDMLEFILLNDLKNNIFDKFDDVFKVETIWNLKLGKNIININNIQDKNILILQSEPKAKYLDFGILSKSNILNLKLLKIYNYRT